MSYEVDVGTAVKALVFLMVDVGDHISGKAGLTPTVTLSKNGGAFASPAGAVTEIASGWYKVAANATDSGTIGALALHAEAAGLADPTDMLFSVVARAPQVIGCWTRTGSTYLVDYSLVIGGALVTAALSSLSVTFRDKDGTDLLYTGSPSQTVAGIVKASGTLSTPVVDNTPISVVVSATFGGVVFSGVLPGLALA